MNLKNMQIAAMSMGRSVYRASERPTQEGDFLYLDLDGKPSLQRTPIRLDTWEFGMWNEPPPIDNLVLVVGDYDVVRLDATSQRPILADWSKCYVESPVGAEFWVFSAKDALILSKHTTTNTTDKRVLACLAEAVQYNCDTTAPGRPTDDQLILLREQAQKFLQAITNAGPEEESTSLIKRFLRLFRPPKNTEHNKGDDALVARYRDAPLLCGWPAPEFENELSRALVRCALEGGKQANKHFQGVPRSVAVPAWSPQ